MNSPNLRSHSQMKAALCAALSSPSGEMNQVLKQLARERSEPSSPMSPIISLPAPTHSPSISPQNPQNKLSPAPTLAIKQETSLACSKDYEMVDTPSPTVANNFGGSQETPVPSSFPDVKPVLYLDLSSPQYLCADSPSKPKQEKDSSAIDRNCSVSSILDRDLPNNQIIDAVPSSFSEFETYTQRKSQITSSSPGQAFPPLLPEPPIKAEEKMSDSPPPKSNLETFTVETCAVETCTLDQTSPPECDDKEIHKSTPLFDLSRPITGQRVKQLSSNLSGKMDEMNLTSEHEAMEIPSKSLTPHDGDYTLLGIEFETLSNVSANGNSKRLKMDSSEVQTNFGWDSPAFKYMTSDNQVSKSDEFGCSQLEVPFSQLENQEGLSDRPSQSSGSSTDKNICRRKESPSVGALRMRSRRARRRIMKSIVDRRTKMDQICIEIQICKTKIQSSSVVVPKPDTVFWVRDNLKECSKVMGEIKTANRRDHEIVQIDCNVLSTTQVAVTDALDEELDKLMLIYVTYRNVVMLLRKCYDKTENKKGGNHAVNAENKSRSLKKEAIKEESKEGIKYKKKRNALCVVEGGAVHGPSESASQNKNSSTTTTKKTPSKASRQIKAQPHCEAGTVTNSPTTSQRSPKVKKVPERRSQLIIENFFKQQRLSIENGENPVARMQLKQSLAAKTPALPTRVKRLREEYSPSAPSSSPTQSPSSPPSYATPLTKSAAYHRRQNPEKQFLTPEIRKPTATRDMSTSTPRDTRNMSTSTPEGTRDLTTRTVREDLISYPSPAVKEIKIKNARYKTPEQLVTRVTAQQALSQLDVIHLSPCFKPQNKDPAVLAGDSLLNYPDVLMEKIPESRNLTEEETQIPCMPVPSETNAVVDKVVQFLVQEKKIDTGLNAVFTSLSNEKTFASLEEKGMIFYENIIFKSCEHWLRSLHSGSNVDTLQMVYSSRTGNSLHQDMQEHWLAERAALQLSKKECAGDINPDIKSTLNEPDSFGVHRDGLEFFDIISILETNVEVSLVGLEEYTSASDLMLPPHFWLVESAGLPSSMLADIDDWPN